MQCQPSVGGFIETALPTLDNHARLAASSNFTTFDWISIIIAVISLIVAVIALYKTCSDIKDKKLNDFINSVFVHLKSIQSVYNDCLIIIDNESIDANVNFLNIEKDLLTDFNFLFYYALFKENVNLKIFATMTNNYDYNSFAHVFLEIEEKYKQFRNSLPNSNISLCDISKLKEYLGIFNDLNKLVHKYIRTMLYEQDKKATCEYIKKLQKIAMKGANL